MIKKEIFSKLNLEKGEIFNAVNMTNI